MVLRKVKPGEVKELNLNPVDAKTEQQALEILNDVKAHGEQGLRKHAERLGDLKPGEKFIYNKEELKAAFDELDERDQGVLQRTAQRIKAFAEAQRKSVQEMTVDVAGGKAGYYLKPFDAAGCYAPGGRYPLPSSVLMTAVTARVAGVPKVWVASPRPAKVTLAAAHVAGADALLAVGGPQAVGAFAYGLGDVVPACGVIVGPGNRWVTAAKRIVSGTSCAIDMLAGPSECLVLADKTANAAIIAADLLAQAEHDTDALPILITTHEPLIDDVNAELEKQLKTLTTAATADVSARKGFAVYLETMEKAIAMCDMLAPEHLEVMTENSKQDADKLKHYGAVFIGERSAEVFGDYGAGPNHVLPTGGSSKYTGALSVFTFLQYRTWTNITETNAESLSLMEDAAHLARLEGLEGHARAAEMRLPDSNGTAAKKARTE